MKRKQLESSTATQVQRGCKQCLMSVKQIKKTRSRHKESSLALDDLVELHVKVETNVPWTLEYLIPL